MCANTKGVAILEILMPYIYISDDFVLPSRIEFLGRTLQLLLALVALLAFLGLDLNPQERCSADDGIIYSLIALIVVSE